MKISTKGRYGLRMVLDLAIHYKAGLIPLKDIAKRQEISEKYLEQIIIVLNRSGLLKSVRGSQGGYSLAVNPKDITVGQVLRALEGSLCPVDCAEEECGATCDRSVHCVTKGVWVKLKNAIDDVVDNITIADLVDEYDQKNGADFVI